MLEFILGFILGLATAALIALCRATYKLIQKGDNNEN